MDAEAQLKPKNKGGRPRKHDGESTRKPTLGFRVRDNLREKLETSARAARWSVSEEIERRLLRSFEVSPDPMDQTALSMIADVWQAIRSVTGKDWHSDHYALTAACESAVTTMAILAKVSMGAKGIEFAQPYQSENSALFGRTYAEAIAMKRAGISTPETETKLLDILEDVERKRRYNEALAAELARPGSPDPVAQFAQDPAVTAADVKDQGAVDAVVDVEEFDETAVPPRRDRAKKKTPDGALIAKS